MTGMRSVAWLAALALLSGACSIISGLTDLDYDLVEVVDETVQPPACEAPTVMCDGACVDLDSSLAHCGACGVACSYAQADAECVAGECAMLGCVETFEDCNDDSADGCESDLESDPNSCGSCDLVCPVDGSAPHTEAACAGSICTTVCESGWDDCDGTIGCETEVDADAANCGSCGHDCGGGACEQAVCQPVVIATGQQASVLVVDGTYLYWNTKLPAPNGRILRVDTAGNGSVEIVVDNLDLPASFAVDISNVYVAQGAAGCVPNTSPCLARSLKSPADPSINGYRGTADTPTGLIAGGGYVYYILQGAVMRTIATFLFSPNNLGASQPPPSTELALSTDGATIYWGAANGGVASIWSAATDGSGAGAIGTTTEWPVSITVFADNIYTTGVNGTLESLASDANGGQAATVVPNLGSIFPSLAKTADEIVALATGQPATWVRPDGNDGFLVEQTVPTPGLPVDFGSGNVPVAADATAVYWLDTGGTITKLVR